MDNIKEMNIYEKMSNARVMVQEEGIKKNGKNSFAKYDYWKLADLNPVINKALRECRLCSQFQVTEQIAMLTIINVDNVNEEMLFSMPFIDAEMSKVTPIQNFGASISYLQRYLILEAFQIGESEIDVDSTEASENREVNQKQGKASNSCKDEVVSLSRTKADEGKRSSVNEIIKKHNNGSVSLAKINDEDVLLKIKAELELL